MAGWYSTALWRSRRAAQLAAEPLCRMCAAQGRVKAARVADHVEPHRGDWRKFSEGELQSLCDTCHSAAKQSQERTGHLPGSDASGFPLDPNHHWSRG